MFFSSIIFTGCWSDAQVAATRPPCELDACLQSPRQPCCYWTASLHGEGVQDLVHKSFHHLNCFHCIVCFANNVCELQFIDYFPINNILSSQGGGVASSSPASCLKQPGDSSCFSSLKPIGCSQIITVPILVWNLLHGCYPQFDSKFELNLPGSSEI